MRTLTMDDIEPALFGGLLLSAGGSGRNATEKNRILGRMALEYGAVRLVGLDELDPNDIVITATGVGAPGFKKAVTRPRDAINAAQRLVENIGMKPAGVICGHVPGFNAWLVAAALDIHYVDAAANGRGHPTVKMGGMGLSSRPDISITQVASSGSKAGKDEFVLVAEGDIVRTSNVMRQAAIANGGLISAARGPLTARFIKENGAANAITFQLELGRAIMDAKDSARVAAAVNFLKGELLVEGEIVRNSVTYGDGFDVGELRVRGGGREVVLGVYNEFMTADVDGERIATFPDMIGSMDPKTGDIVAIADLKEGDHVSVIASHRSNFPVGKGALDPTVFPEVETAMSVDLRSYL
jgi:DUF917 family protein